MEERERVRKAQAELQAEFAATEEARESLPKRRFPVSGRGAGRSAALAAVQAEKGRRARQATLSRRKVRDVAQVLRDRHGESRIVVRQNDVPPMTAERRMEVYTTQNDTLKLTPAQRRRLKQKAHRTGERVK